MKPSDGQKDALAPVRLSKEQKDALATDATTIRGIADRARTMARTFPESTSLRRKLIERAEEAESLATHFQTMSERD